MAGERKYRVGPAVGKGGFGTVYRADIEGEAGFRKRVALKMLNEDLRGMVEIRQRMRDEARMLGLVHHRAIVQVDGIVRLSGRWTLVIEWVDGVDLDVVLQTTGPIPPGSAMEILEEIASALEAAYDAPGPDGRPLQLLHRDIKPGNIRLTAQGSVKVLDFGVARARFEGREALTQDNIFGSLSYMAPERLHHEEHPSGDVWSLGILLCEMLLARPLDLKPIDPRHCKRAVTRALAAVAATGTPDAILELATAMLSWDAEQRPTAREVARTARRLSRSLGGEPLPDWAERVVPKAWSPPPPIDDPLIGTVLTEDPSPDAAPAQSTRPELIGHLPTHLDDGPATTPFSEEGPGTTPLVEVTDPFLPPPLMEMLHADDVSIDLVTDARGIQVPPRELTPELTDLGKDLVTDPSLHETRKKRDDESTLLQSPDLQAAIEAERGHNDARPVPISEQRPAAAHPSPESLMGTMLLNTRDADALREAKSAALAAASPAADQDSRAVDFRQVATVSALGVVVFGVVLVVVFAVGLALLPSFNNPAPSPPPTGVGLEQVGVYEAKTVEEPEVAPAQAPPVKAAPKTTDPVADCFDSDNVAVRAVQGRLSAGEERCLKRIYDDQRYRDTTRLRAATPATDHHLRLCTTSDTCGESGHLLALVVDDLGSDALPYLSAYAVWLNEHGNNSASALRKRAAVAERALAHPSAAQSFDLTDRLHRIRTMSTHELWRRDAKVGLANGESRARAWDAAEDWVRFREGRGEQADIARQMCVETSDGRGECGKAP